MSDNLFEDVNMDVDNEKKEVKKEEKPKTRSTKEKTKPLCIGLDCGTMNLVCGRSDSKDTTLTRNVFLKLDPDEVAIGELSEISYVKGDEGELYVIGEDAFRMANIFGQEVSRPMKSGLISSDEIDAIDVLTLIIKDLIGDTGEKNEVYCSYSIPAESIDEKRSVTYHTRVFGSILNNIGINHTPINEAAAIIYSECQKEGFTGIGLSFGAGMVNCCVMYKGVEAVKFSTARSGDWVDKQVADSLGLVANRVTSTKEKHLDLIAGAGSIKNKKQRRTIEAIIYYYEALMEYTIKRLIKEFEENIDLEIDDELPIVISGGTSLPNGFDDLFKDVLSRYELPFEVSEIRRAGNPLTSVANGLLIKTIADNKK